MTTHAKYIIIDKGWIAPIVFSELLTHAEVARALGGTVIGAGFCQITEQGRYECYGKSVSLGIKSDEESDAKILNKELGVDFVNEDPL